jgi:DNA-binding transcriptional LysR family regulator
LGRLRRLLNDPLFLRTPKGVVPTARATELAEPVADILARVRRIVSTAEPFDPAKSTRRFILGAPDAISAVLLPPLLADLRRTAPGIDIGVRQVEPQRATASPPRGTRRARLRRCGRSVRRYPARFAAHHRRRGFRGRDAPRPSVAAAPTLERYCEMPHLVTSQTGTTHAYVDRSLPATGSPAGRPDGSELHAGAGLVAETDFVVAMPKTFVATHGPRFGVTSVEAPVPLIGSDPRHRA